VRSRLAAAAAGTAGLLTLAAGCGHTTVAYGTPEMAGRLAGTVRHVVEEHGYPVEDDHVGCTGHGPGRTISCYGATPDEPTTPIHATFTPSGSGCSGSLVVELAGTPLTPRRADPCG
jgi:hypothetical protein